MILECQELVTSQQSSWLKVEKMSWHTYFVCVVLKWLRYKEKILMSLYGVTWGIPVTMSSGTILLSLFSPCTKIFMSFSIYDHLGPTEHAWRISWLNIYMICPYIHMLESARWSNMSLKRLPHSCWSVRWRQMVLTVSVGCLCKHGSLLLFLFQQNISLLVLHFQLRNQYLFWW